MQNIHPKTPTRANYRILDLIEQMVAVAPKGAGFYGEGTNPAHNLPLVENPSVNDVACERFSFHASKLFVEKEELEESIKIISNHKTQGIDDTIVPYLQRTKIKQNRIYIMVKHLI